MTLPEKPEAKQMNELAEETPSGMVEFLQSLGPEDYKFSKPEVLGISKTNTERATELHRFLESELAKGSFNERLVARIVRRELYYLSKEDIEAVNQEFSALKPLKPLPSAQTEKAGERAVGSGHGESLFSLMKRLTPNYTGTFERLLSRSASTGIEPGYKVAAETLFKQDSGLKPGEFQTITLDGGRQYSVFIPKEVDKRGLVIMGLDGVRMGESKTIMDQEVQGSLLSKNDGAIFFVPHTTDLGLPFNPTIKGKVGLQARRIPFADRFYFDRDIRTDKEQKDVYYFNADISQIIENVSKIRGWNMSNPKYAADNLFKPNPKFDDLDHIKESWQDLRKRLAVPDLFAVQVFSNGGLAGKVVHSEMPQAVALDIFMSTTMADSEIPSRPGNVRIVAAMGDNTLRQTEAGGAGWRGKHLQALTPNTRLELSRPFKMYSDWQQANQCTGERTETRSDTLPSYTIYKYTNCRAGELSVINITDKRFGHAFPDKDNLHLAQGSRPAPLNFGADSRNFLLDHIKKRLLSEETQIYITGGTF